MPTEPSTSSANNTELPTNGVVSKESSDEAISMYKGQKSVLIMVIGKSGRGKSTAIRTLNPATTHIINVIGKPLPFQQGMKYVPGENMTITSNADQIRREMDRVSREGKVTDLVIDDIQYVMATEFMDKALVKGYDKFSIMARNIWEILIKATKLRAGLKVYVLAHEEETETERRMKTLGKLLNDKITPEGLSTIVLYSDVTGERDNRKYFFSTQSDGVTNAKSPFEMFPAQIPNDLKLVSSRIDEYYAGVSLKNSKIRMEV